MSMSKLGNWSTSELFLCFDIGIFPLDILGESLRGKSPDPNAGLYADDCKSRAEL